MKGEVSFENVCFQYEPDKPVLTNLTLHVRPGQTVALVGQTGCGKSTIVNLLYRYYDVASGRLAIQQVLHEGQLDVSGLPGGIYFLKLRSPGRVFHSKVLINK